MVSQENAITFHKLLRDEYWGAMIALHIVPVTDEKTLPEVSFFE